MATEQNSNSLAPSAQADKRPREEAERSGSNNTGPLSDASDSAAKKARVDDPSVSKVLHIRNLPPDTTELEVMGLAGLFGGVVKVLVMKVKNQGFIELADQSMASKMVDYYSNVPATIRDRTVYIQYSKHQQLKAQSTLGSGALSGVGASIDTTGSISSEGMNSILRVIVENMIYPITLDVLHQIFSKYGDIIRIVTFYKNAQFHALIQYSDAVSAANAKVHLDSRNIYNECCTLRIDYSKLSNLTVKYNNEKTRDYTCDLPPGEGETSGTLPAVHDLAAFAGMSPGLLQNPASLRAVIDAMSRNNPTTLTATAGVMPSPVVLVSNLNDQIITPHALFILFGVYGDVVRVKILYNKRDSALIQFREPQHAQTAINNLNGVSLYGKKVHVTNSKHSQVQMPQPGSKEDALTEDHGNSTLHRFKKPGSKNHQNIFPPSPTLHLSNIPEGIDDQYIKTLFSSTGGSVINFRFFQNDHRMALIQMSSVEEAVAALIGTHNYKISETNHLRVSFSKNFAS